MSRFEEFLKVEPEDRGHAQAMRVADEVTIAQYYFDRDVFLVAQVGKCAICGTEDACGVSLFFVSYVCSTKCYDQLNREFRRDYAAANRNEKREPKSPGTVRLETVYRRAAYTRLHKEGYLEIDDMAQVHFCRENIPKPGWDQMRDNGKVTGAYVQAWVYLSREDVLLSISEHMSNTEAYCESDDFVHMGKECRG